MLCKKNTPDYIFTAFMNKHGKNFEEFNRNHFEKVLWGIVKER